MNDVSKLIWDLKENQPQAIAKIAGIPIPAFEKWELQLRNVDRCRDIISIPGHEKGKINLGCEAIATQIATNFPWLRHLSDVLR